MFVLLQRRDRAELVLSVDGQDVPAIEAFLDRFNISKECGPSFTLLRLAAHSTLLSKSGGRQYSTTRGQRI
jgi:hypothetical protein